VPRIPLFTARWWDGQIIANALQAGSNATVYLLGSGVMDTGDFAALQLWMGALNTTPSLLYDTGLSFAAALAQRTDPCQQRIQMMWCEGYPRGRLVIISSTALTVSGPFGAVVPDVPALAAWTALRFFTQWPELAAAKQCDAQLARHGILQWRQPFFRRWDVS
jgi:hypothetical protein